MEVPPRELPKNTFDVSLTREDLDVITAALGKMPLENVIGTFTRLQQQVRAQVQPEAAPSA